MKTRTPILTLLLSAAAFGQAPTVGNVERCFNGLKHHGEWMNFWQSPGVQAPIPTDHYQGIARHPDPRYPIFYLSQSNTTGAQPGDDGLLVVVRLDSRDTLDLYRMRSNRLVPNTPTESTAPAPEDRVVAAVTIADYKHPGGMQACGNILAVGLESPTNANDPSGKIAFFDISSPRQPVRLPFSVNTPGHNIGVVAFTQLPDRRYILALTWGSNDRVDILISTPDDLSTFAFYDSLTAGTADILGVWPGGGLQSAHQTLNFVTQSDGRLFLIGMHNTSNASPIPLGDDVAYLYRVDFMPGNQVRFVQVAAKHMYCADLTAQTGSNGNFAAAGGVFVSPDGDLILYAATHATDYLHGNWTGMSEFRHHLLREDRFGGPCTGYVELYADTNFRGRSFVHDSMDRGLENWANFGGLDDETFDTETGFHDQASSVVWNLPVGTSAVLYEDDTFRGKSLVLAGTGRTEIIPDLHAISWSSGSGNPGDKISSLNFIGAALLPDASVRLPRPGIATFNQAFNASDGGPCAFINIYTGTYIDLGTYNKQVLLRAVGGPVTIGF